MKTIKLQKNIIPVTGVFVCLFLMFKFPYNVSKGVTEGVKICFYTILPSLFPFMVLSSYIVKSDAFSPFYKLIAPAVRFLFKQPACAAGVIAMSLIGGFPVGAKMTFELLESGKITKNQAQRLNAFCVNCGPAFAVTAVGVSMYRSAAAGVIIYVSVCISSLLIGVITSFFKNSEKAETRYKTLSDSAMSALPSAVSDSVQSVLSVCAWIILFSAFTSCLKGAGLGEGVCNAIICVAEVTDGCRIAAELFPIPVTAAVISFGGLCVHCQVYRFVRASGLPYIRFFTARAVGAALSALICRGLLAVFPVEVSAAAINEGLTAVPYSVSLPAFFALAVSCIVMIFDIDTKKKIW